MPLYFASAQYHLCGWNEALATLRFGDGDLRALAPTLRISEFGPLC